MAIIPGTPAGNVLVGGAANDLMNNDPIAGTIGSAGIDSVYGNGGNDILNGGDGNDTLNGGVGNDTLHGGVGNDTADYSSGVTSTGRAFTGAVAGVTVNLSLAVAQLTGGAGTDQLVGIENLTGSNFNDTLTGNAARNVLIGLSGNDVLFGLAGNDILFGDTGNDVLLGGLGADLLNGGAGDDVLQGGLGNDVLNGGLGSDTADYFGAAAGVTVNLNLAAQNSDTLVGIEHLSGSSLNDTLIGNATRNALSGLAGNDVLSGLAGDDSLLGGLGNDTLLGGGGDDVLQGGLGNDLLNGGLGSDTADYFGAAAGVTVNLNLAAQNTVGAGVDTLVGIENLSGSNVNDTLIGNGANNVLSGLNGNDTLRGGAGRDNLTGGGGALAFDTFDYNDVSDSGPGVLNRDVITDFNGRGALAGDRIDLTTIDANTTLFAFGNQAFTYIGGAAFSAPGQLRYAGGILSGNTDFDAAAEIEIQLIGGPATLFVTSGFLGFTDVLL